LSKKQWNEIVTARLHKLEDRYFGPLGTLLDEMLADGYEVVGGIKVYETDEGEALLPIGSIDSDYVSPRMLAMLLISNGVMDIDDVKALIDITLMKAMRRAPNNLYSQDSAMHMSAKLETQLANILKGIHDENHKAEGNN
jgi:hypothetical protein